MKRYAGFMMNRYGKLGLMAKPLGIKGASKKYAVNLGQSFGEWAKPADVYPNDWKDIVAPHPEVSTAYTSYVLGCMAEIAEELGHSEDAALFCKYSEGSRRIGCLRRKHGCTRAARLRSPGVSGVHRQYRAVLRISCPSGCHSRSSLFARCRIIVLKLSIMRHPFLCLGSCLSPQLQGRGLLRLPHML